MAGIYIHIPFCISKCSYCDFYSCTSTAKLDSFIGALIMEMQARKDFLNGEPVKTIYFGGGTPSLMSTHQIRTILHEIYDTFDPEPKEVTLEANPDDLSPEYMAELAGTAVNRLSIGIQSFDDDHLKLMNRRHTASQAEKAVRDAQRAGFDNISADLIFGIPGMDNRTWEQNIDQMISLGVQHISAYHLTIEEGTRFAKMAAEGKITAVDEDTSEQQYEILRSKLGAAGFEHYEISNFALPGYRAQHNSSYWKGEPYLGLGPSAHSYDRNERIVCVADTDSYIRQSPAHELFDIEKLSQKDKYNEHVMVRLRCTEGIDLEYFKKIFGGEMHEKLLHKAQKLIQAGDLYIKGCHISVPCNRFLVSDRIISELFDI